MSGIAGIFGDIDADRIDHALDRMAHRGHSEKFVRHFEGFGSLGTTLRSIVDPEHGEQPLFNEDRTLALVCNGEIYNHRAIRRDLMGDHQFRSRSDSEVILHLYEEYGDDLVKFLDGMYAFILFDLTRGRCLIARDPLGIKPLWYRTMGRQTYVASEIKALIGLGRGRIQELPPGTANASDREMMSFWVPDLKTSQPDLALCRTLLASSVRKQMMGGVEIGVLLSGGVDSSIITALAAQENPRIKAVTVGLEDSPDVAMARRVAEHLSIEHVVRTFTLDDLQDLVDEVVYHTESYNPSMVTKAMVTYMAAQAARDAGVRVVLSGDGADELFAGHSAVRSLSFLELRSKLDALLRNLHKTELKRLDRMTMAVGLEARVPFLDQNLVEYAFNLPSAEKIHDVDGLRVEKWHLRMSFEGLLPDELIWRPMTPMDIGTGAGDVIHRIEVEIPDQTFREKREQYAPWNIQSKEMLRYFEVWKGHFGELLEPGRTFEMFGDYPVLMDEIARRGSAP